MAGKKHLVGKPLVILADHRDLQFFARAKVGKHARLAHVGDLCQRADTQAFKPNLLSQPQGGVDDELFGLLTLLQGALTAGHG
jgi:hypothetical protein